MSFYGLIRDTFSRVLVEAGFLSSVESGTDNMHAEDCLAGPAEHEPILDGEKWMASAQVRHDGNVLQHGSIFYDEASWPEDWDGSRPGFLGNSEGDIFRSDLMERFVEGVLSDCFADEVCVPRELSRTEWEDLRNNVDQFSPDGPSELPCFRRSSAPAVPS